MVPFQLFLAAVQTCALYNDFIAQAELLFTGHEGKAATGLASRAVCEEVLEAVALHSVESDAVGTVTIPALPSSHANLTSYRAHSWFRKRNAAFALRYASHRMTRISS